MVQIVGAYGKALRVIIGRGGGVRSPNFSEDSECPEILYDLLHNPKVSRKGAFGKVESAVRRFFFIEPLPQRVERMSLEDFVNSRIDLNAVSIDVETSQGGFNVYGTDLGENARVVEITPRVHQSKSFSFENADTRNLRAEVLRYLADEVVIKGGQFRGLVDPGSLVTVGFYAPFNGHAIEKAQTGIRVFQRCGYDDYNPVAVLTCTLRKKVRGEH